MRDNLARVYNEEFPEESGYKKAHIAVDTYATEDSKDIFHGQATLFSVPLFEINDSKLKTPVRIKINREGAWFFAENDTLVITGEGKTPTEAIEDFKSHILYFVNYYRNITDNNLTGDAVRLKKIFKDLL